MSPLRLHCTRLGRTSSHDLVPRGPKQGGPVQCSPPVGVPSVPGAFVCAPAAAAGSRRRLAGSSGKCGAWYTVCTQVAGSSEAAAQRRLLPSRLVLLHCLMLLRQIDLRLTFECHPCCHVRSPAAGRAAVQASAMCPGPAAPAPGLCMQLREGDPCKCSLQWQQQQQESGACTESSVLLFGGRGVKPPTLQRLLHSYIGIWCCSAYCASGT